EEATAVYAWDFDADATTLDPAPNSNLPDPRYVAPPSGVQLINSATSFYSRADGTAVPYLDITWNEPASPDVVTEVFWKRAEETDFRLLRTAANATSARIEPVSGSDTLNLYLAHVSATGARSNIYWVPTFTLNADLPTNGQPIGTLSANLLANASFEYGVERWGNIFGNAVFLKEQFFAIAGPISNARLQITSTATGPGNTAYVISDRIAVREGARYVAFCGLIGQSVDPFVAVYWYDGADTQLSGVNGNIVPGYAIQTAPSPSSLANYAGDGAVSSLFATAPAGARYARLFLAAGGNWTASDIFGLKYLWAARPFFGEVPLGTTELPPWDGGGSPVVGTGGLAQGAATDMTSGDSPGAVFGNPGPQFIDVAPFAITAAASGTFEVSMTFEVSGSGTGGGGGGENRMYAGIYETAKGVALISREALTAPANETRRATVTLFATIQASAGETIRPILRISRTRYGIVGGVTVGNTTDSVGVISWRATLVKR
ncbi:MAG: hypothetical protein RL756_2309, partial [Pseudomonadota bacterium]